MRWLRTVIRDLSAPGTQAADWYGWATNQCGHALLGATLSGAVLLAGETGAASVVVVLTVAIIKECVDAMRGGKIPDSLADIGFWTCGAIMAAALHSDHGLAFAACVIALTGGLALGIRQRVTPK